MPGLPGGTPPSGSSSGPSVTASATPATPTPTPAPGASETPSTGGVRFSPTGAGKLDGKTIVLDPGHNAHYIRSINNVRKPLYGTIGARCQAAGGTGPDKKTTEQDIVWDISQKVLPRLLEQGATVILTRPNNDGTGPCNDERAQMANRAKADFLISLHTDGAESQKARGIYAIVPKQSPGGKALIDADKAAASTILAALKTKSTMPPSTYLGSTTGGIVELDEAVVNNLTSTRGVLLEFGNIIQTDDWAILNSDAGRQGLADGVVQGLVDVLAP